MAECLRCGGSGLRGVTHVCQTAGDVPLPEPSQPDSFTLSDAFAMMAALKEEEARRNEWLETQLRNTLEGAEAVALACGLATARAVVGDLRDALEMLASTRTPPASPESDSGRLVAREGQTP